MKYVVVVRGKLKGSPAEAGKAHNEIIAKTSQLSKSMGNTQHHPFLNVQDGNMFQAIDFWDNIEGIQKLYNDPSLAAEFAKMFEGMPEVTIWADSGWSTY